MSRFQRFLQSPFTFVYRGVRRRYRDLTGTGAAAVSQAAQASSSKLKASAKPKLPAPPAPAPAPVPAPAPAHNPVADLLTDILAEADYDQFDKTVAVAVKRTSDNRLLKAYVDLRAQAALAQGKHDELKLHCDVLRDRFSSPDAFRYMGESCFLRGQYKEAIGALQTYLYYRPADPDAVYLLAESAFHSGQPELAWEELESLTKHSKRARTWLVLANQVTDQISFGRLLRNWHGAVANKMVPALHKDICEYVALGAIRSGNYAMGKQIWRDTVLAIVADRKHLARLKPKNVNYSARRAEITLFDLDAALRAAAIEVFLVSGTLLGCVREGRLLGHDKDIDVGIWDDVPQAAVFAALQASGKFYMLASRSPEIIRVRHANGISVDIFYHYREADDYWHSGVKIKWHNKPFTLVEREFLGHHYLIPEDYDTYLTENYGDWRTPKIDFDSAYDTPNAEVLDQDELIMHTYKHLMDKMILGRFDKVRFYAEKLYEMGETDFADKFRASQPQVFSDPAP